MLQIGRPENGQAAPHRKAGCDDKDVLGEPGIARVRYLVEDMLGDDHGHDDGLAGAGRHIGAHALERATVGRDIDAHPVDRWRFSEPDERFGRLKLTEEEPSALELLGVMRVLQQALRNPRYAGVASGTPSLDPLSNGNYKLNLT